MRTWLCRRGSSRCQSIISSTLPCVTDEVLGDVAYAKALLGRGLLTAMPVGVVYLLGGVNCLPLRPAILIGAYFQGENLGCVSRAMVTPLTSFPSLEALCLEPWLDCCTGGGCLFSGPSIFLYIWSRGGHPLSKETSSTPVVMLCFVHFFLGCHHMMDALPSSLLWWMLCHRSCFFL